MVLIAENIHIISKTTKEAILQKNDEYILNIVNNVLLNKVNVFDLNIGPAKASLAGSMQYLTKLIDGNFDVNFSFDTSNFCEMKEGFEVLSTDKAKNSFINSICAEDNKKHAGFEIAIKNNSNIIALTFNPDKGIAKTSDERLELAFSIFGDALSNGINEEKLYFDPLVLPVSAAQNQANIVLETIRMLKEGMPGIHTVVGLSNISNGSPKELRPLLNRVFLVLCMGAGLDAAIVDGLDLETIRIYHMINDKNPASDIDRLYFSLYNSINTFSDIDEVQFNTNDDTQINIMKTPKILLDKEIYSHSFCLNI